MSAWPSMPAWLHGCREPEAGSMLYWSGGFPSSRACRDLAGFSIVGSMLCWSVSLETDQVFWSSGRPTSVSGACHYIECVTPIGTHRRPPEYTHTAKKVSQPSAMPRNSQVTSSRREIPEITGFIVLFLICKLSLAILLSPVATQWWPPG